MDSERFPVASPANSAGPANPDGPATPVGSTGDPRVDEAVATLAALGDRPLEEHPPVLEAVHDKLREVLGEIGEPGRPGRPGHQGELGGHGGHGGESGDSGHGGHGGGL